MKALTKLSLLAAIVITTACSTAPDLGGNANSDNGKAFIAAIKGKLYAEEAHTTAITVADNGDVTLNGNFYRFAGAPSKTTALYYIPAEVHTSNGLSDKTMVSGIMIDGNTVYYVSAKKSGDEIAKELGFKDANDLYSTGTKDNQKELLKRYYTADNVDFSKKTGPAGYIKP